MLDIHCSVLILLKCHITPFAITFRVNVNHFTDLIVQRMPEKITETGTFMEHVVQKYRFDRKKSQKIWTHLVMINRSNERKKKKCRQRTSGHLFLFLVLFSMKSFASFH